MTDKEKEFYLLLLGGWKKSVYYEDAWIFGYGSYYSLDMACRIARGEYVDPYERTEWIKTMKRLC